MKKPLITKQALSIIFSLLFGFLLLLSAGCENDNGHRGGGNDNPPLPYMNVPEALDVVMYSVNPRVFAEQDALKAITARLDDIKALGTNVIWLMPLYAQGEGPQNVKSGRGSPYCIRDYKAINPEYGTVEDLRRLINEAHKRDMAVIMDWVANHTSWDNAWIKNEGWYATNANGDIIHPPGTDWTDVAQLNFDNTDMREAMVEAMIFWFAEANIDGFRMDAVDHVPFDFWVETVPKLRAANEGRRILLFAEGNRRDYVGAAGFDMDFGWNFYNRLNNLYNRNSLMSGFFNTAATEVRNGRVQVRFTTNHDKSAWEKTDVQLFNGERGAMSAFVITATLGGIPMIYSTQEIGRKENVPFFSVTNIDWNSNPAITNEYKAIMKAYTSTDVFARGTVVSYPSLRDIVCFTKTKDDKTALVVVNIRNNNVTFSVPEALQGDWKNMMDNSTFTLPQTVEMTPYQYYILEKLP